MSGATAAGGAGAIVRQGHLRKLKTMKKKYFVLRAETAECSAKLEYYESEKKFRSGAMPRRVLSLKSCYNITRRLDLKQKHVIALFTREEQFCVVADNEKDLHTWLSAILKQNRPDDVSEELLHPIQHVWQVNVQKKGLGASKNIQGLYNLCLTDKTLTLVKIKSHNNVISDLGIPERIEYALKNIRRCGDSECFFYMEVGRQTSTGAGEIWMHMDDSNIAQSMHSTIYHAMKNCAKETENERDHIILPGPTLSVEATYPLPARRQTISDSRGRSGIANEKGLCVGSCIRQCVCATATYSIDDSEAAIAPLTPKLDAGALRNRCDSMPSRVSSALEADRLPTRNIDPEGVCAVRDEADGEWHRTPGIPEEPDYCDMTRDFMSLIDSRSRCSGGGGAGVGEAGCAADGYLSMVPTDGGLVSASSGSVCSGTPSTDPRFSEYQLDPARSHLAEAAERPARAYSVGSRPAPPPDCRHRAYSVGARHRPHHHQVPRHHTGRSSASAPLLPRASAEDLMELDFSNNQGRVSAASPVAAVAFVAPRNLDEYVDMSPRVARPAHTPPPAAPAAPATPDGYVEMTYTPRPSTKPIAIAARPKPTTGSLAGSPQTPAREDSVPSRCEPQTPPGSQTLFSLSLDSPASPVRPDDQPELELDDPAHPLSTLREISEEGRRSPEISCSPLYVKLTEGPRTSQGDVDELACNPTATKTLMRAAEAVDSGGATLVRAGSGAPARFSVAEEPAGPAPPPGVIYAALDLEPRGPASTLPPRVYTQIDFIRSEKLHADAN